MADLLIELENRGLTLPKAPAPVASYIPAVSIHSGSLVFISGQLPLKNGELMATGTVPDAVPLKLAQECAAQCVLNALAVLEQEIGDLKRVRRVVRLGGFVACGAGFGDQSKVINGASDLLAELMHESGKHARAAVGVSALPLNAPVEIEFTFLVD
ncbi:MAG: RidA family protein [Phycisphaerales bacterium JB050]